jgi:hypothetical protein
MSSINRILVKARRDEMRNLYIYARRRPRLNKSRIFMTNIRTLKNLILKKDQIMSNPNYFDYFGNQSIFTQEVFLYSKRRAFFQIKLFLPLNYLCD